MYNKKVLSKAVKELHTPRAPKRKNGNTNIVSNTKPIVSDQGYKQGPPPEGTHYRIPGDTLYNPTPYSITAVSDNGIVKELKPYDETPVLFPGANYVDEYPQMQIGGTHSTSLSDEDEMRFQKFYSTLPDNLMDDDPSYDIRGYWDALGRPSEFDYSQPKESDGYYQAFSINPNTGEYLKAPWHPTFQHAVDEDRKIGWRPITNVYGRNIAVENPSIIEPEEQSFLRNTEGPIYELTDEEIQAYRDGGYIVEELPKAQNGIYISDPDEYKERKEMYQDSLDLYNFTKDFKSQVGSRGDDPVSLSNYLKNTKIKLGNPFLHPNNPRITVSDVWDADGNFTKDLSKAVHAEFTHPTIMPTGAYKPGPDSWTNWLFGTGPEYSSGNLTYDKPVQPVFYKKTPPPVITPPPKPKGTTDPNISVDVRFRKLGLDPSFANRKKVAEQAGIENYKGTAEQNKKLNEWVVENYDPSSKSFVTTTPENIIENKAKETPVMELPVKSAEQIKSKDVIVPPTMELKWFQTPTGTWYQDYVPVLDKEYDLSTGSFKKQGGLIKFLPKAQLGQHLINSGTKFLNLPGVKPFLRSNLNLLSYPAKYAGARVARYNAFPSRDLEDLKKIFSPKYKAEYFGGDDLEKYGFGKRDLIANYFFGNDKGFIPTDYNLDLDLGLKGAVAKYGNLNTYLLNSYIPHGQPISIEALTQYYKPMTKDIFGFLGGGDRQPFDFSDLKSPSLRDRRSDFNQWKETFLSQNQDFQKLEQEKYNDLINKYIHSTRTTEELIELGIPLDYHQSLHPNYALERQYYKDSLNNLFDHYNTDMIPFDVQPKDGLDLPFSFNINPIRPRDNIGGHIIFLKRSPNNEYEMTTRDLWSFRPGDYDKKWGMDTPQKRLQTELMDSFGKPFVLHQTNPIKFQKGGDNVVQCSPDKPCAETDQVQEILDDIHRKKSEALKIDFNIVDNIIKSNSTAEKEFNKYGIKSADQLLNCGNLSNCSTLATGSYKSLDPSIDPVKTLSNYRFKKAVNAKELPFETVGQYSSIKNIPPEELEAGDLISMMGKTDGYDYNHMIKYAGNNSYVQSPGPAEVWEKADWHPEWYPNVPTTVYRYSPRKEEIESLEEIARTNPTYYGVGPLATNPATPISHKEGGLVKAQLGSGLSKYAKPVASLLSTYIKPFQIASELPLFSNYSNVLKNTNLEGWADRFEMANLLSDMNYAGPEFDFLAQMNASKTEDAMNALMQKAIKHDLTGWRQVNPKTIPYKNRFNETVNIDAQRQAMRDAGVDFSNYPSRSQYMATHVPKNIYGDREGGMDRLGSMGMDALYLAGLPQLEMKYAPHQWRVTQPFDFSTGNWNDWFTRHTVNKQPIITEGQFNPKLNPSEVFFDSGYSKGDVLPRQYGMGQGINTRRWASGKGAKIAEPDLDNPFPAFYDFYAISPTERELLRQEQEAVQKGWSTGWADQYRKGGAAEVGDLVDKATMEKLIKEGYTFEEV